MKLFGREPAVWVGVIEAGLAMLVVLGVINFTREQTALVMAVIVAIGGVVTAYLTKDTMLGVLVGLAKAALAVAVGFGAHISPEATASIIAFVVVIIGFFQRTQTSPAPVPSLRPVKEAA